MVGEQLGRYRIVERIGAGGMGVVYRAHDERLDRRVAIKVLPAASLADEVVRRRFHKEALALSRLNHPNIAILYDFDTHAGTDYLVMEEIDGASVDERIAAGALPEAEVVQLGLQMAEALAAAHQAGILHRDLKPGNLRLTRDGRLKVLDFGLAQKLPTRTDVSTRSLSDFGVAAGTLAYMAPEQLRGDEPDERSDIYAAGVVLFEMAAGRHPFEARTGPALVEQIMNRPAPALRTAMPAVTAELERIVAKCLAKSPSDRYQSARELATDLRRLELSTAAIRLGVRPARAPRWMGYGVAGGIAVLALLVYFLLLARFREPGLPVNPQSYVQLTNFATGVMEPALSPDGRILAFSSERGELYAKLLPSGEPKRLVDRGVVTLQPLTFSPDGSRIAYTVSDGARWDTWTAPVLGGAPQPMMRNATALTWIGRDRVLFSQGDAGTHMVLATAGESRTEPRIVYSPAAQTGMAHRSYLSPDGRWVLIVSMESGAWLPCRVVPFEGGGREIVVGPPSSQCIAAAWSPDGKWVYVSSNAGGAFHLWRQRFPNGAPEQVTSGTTEERGFATAPDGTALLATVGSSQSAVWLHDEKGDRQISVEGFAYQPSLSRDRSRAYYLLRAGNTDRFVSGELWETELASGAQRRVLPGFYASHYNISPDGQWALLAASTASGAPGIWLAPLDGRTPPRQLTSGGELRAFFGPGDSVFFQAREGNLEYVDRMHRDGSGRERVLAQPVILLISVSPDGKWLVVFKPAPSDEAFTIEAYPAGGGEPVTICDHCIGGAGPGLVRPPLLSWSADQSFVYLVAGYFDREKGEDGGRDTTVLAVPLSPGRGVPPLPPGGIGKLSQLRPAGARLLRAAGPLFPGPDPEHYLFLQVSRQANLYRIPLP